MSKLNRTSLISRDSGLIAGVKKHFKGATLTIGGKPYTDVQIVAALQAEIDAVNAVTPAHAAWQLSVATAKAQSASLQELLKGLRQTVLAMFGSQPDTLADFSIAPPKKPAKLTANKLVLKVAKSKATRAARHTVGPAVRKTIKGTVSSVDIVTSGSGGTNGSSATTQKP
jgi:hypothetical protein